MMIEAKEIYERVYIYASKTRTQEGWALIIFSMDENSQFAFEPVASPTLEINIKVLRQTFDNILINYNPDINPTTITFITNISKDLLPMLKQTQAEKHNFIFDKTITINAMQEFIQNIKINLVDL